MRGRIYNYVLKEHFCQLSPQLINSENQEVTNVANGHIHSADCGNYVSVMQIYNCNQSI